MPASVFFLGFTLRTLRTLSTILHGVTFHGTEIFETFGNEYSIVSEYDTSK
jgi:hypothetical protein